MGLLLSSKMRPQSPPSPRSDISRKLRTHYPEPDDDMHVASCAYASTACTCQRQLAHSLLLPDTTQRIRPWRQSNCGSLRPSIRSTCSAPPAGGRAWPCFTRAWSMRVCRGVHPGRQAPCARCCCLCGAAVACGGRWCMRSAFGDTRARCSAVYARALAATAAVCVPGPSPTGGRVGGTSRARSCAPRRGRDWCAMRPL